MAKNITIDDNEIPLLLEFYKDKRHKLLDELEGVDNILRQLSPTSPKNNGAGNNSAQQIPLPNFDGYPYKLTWNDKLRFVVGELGEATTSDIVDAVIRYEPNKINSRSSLVPTLSGKLGDFAKRGELFKRRKNDRNEFVYSLL